MKIFPIGALRAGPTVDPFRSGCLAVLCVFIRLWCSHLVLMLGIQTHLFLRNILPLQDWTFLCVDVSTSDFIFTAFPVTNYALRLIKVSRTIFPAWTWFGCVALSHVLLRVPQYTAFHFHSFREKAIRIFLREFCWRSWLELQLFCLWTAILMVIAEYFPWICLFAFEMSLFPCCNWHTVKWFFGLCECN